MSSNLTLKITEIFYSLQGESKTVGHPTVFVRLTGCPLRCTYCDTAYAFSGGDNKSLEQVIKEIVSFKTKYVTITGGEPLAQPACLSLMRQLCDSGYFVSLETSGALSIENVDTRVMRVVDFKTPASGEVTRNLFKNVNYLLATDQVKLVICDRADYEWSKKICKQYDLFSRCEVLLSPSHGQLANAKLADWILEDQLPVRFQLQQHKYIWGDCRGK